MASTRTQRPSVGSPRRPSAIEKPRSVSVSRQSVGQRRDAAHLLVGDLGVPAHPRGVAGALDPVDGLTDGAHVPAVQCELLGDGRIASSPSWITLSPVRAYAIAPSSLAPMTAGVHA